MVDKVMKRPKVKQVQVKEKQAKTLCLCMKNLRPAKYQILSTKY